MITCVATYAQAGEGHRRASEAVAASAQGHPEIRVTLRDCLDGSAAWFRWTYTHGYLLLVRHAPALWGGLYYTADAVGAQGWLRTLRRWGNARQELGLTAWLLEHQPDVVIATHFFPVEVVAALKRRGRLRSKLISAITDWLPHSFWICPGVDRYTVATEVTRQALRQRGVPDAQIAVTGIPIDQRFAAPLDRAVTAQRLGLAADRFTILIASGGFGLGPVEAIVRALAQAPGPYQLLVVAGRNAALQRALEQLRPQIPHPTTVYGFVGNMDDLMAVSDLLISKSGGLTCAEAMARGLPMMIIDPIPGQETRNSTILVNAGAAVQVANVREVVPHLERLRRPEVHARFAAAARRLARPDAAAAVLRLAQTIAHE